MARAARVVDVGEGAFDVFAVHGFIRESHKTGTVQA